MPPRSLSRNINRASAATLAAALAAGAWGWFASGQPATKADKNGVKTTSGEETSRVDSQSRSIDPTHTDSKLWTRSLQSGFRAKPIAPVVQNTVPVTPTPPVPMPAPVIASTDLGLRLVGTVIEKGGSMAIAINREGKLDFCREGASLQLQPEGVRIDAVSEGYVRVSYLGKSANWSMGQPLRFDDGAGDAMDGAVSGAVNGEVSGAGQIETKPAGSDGSALKSKPKMGIEEELEMINGNSSSVPF